MNTFASQKTHQERDVSELIHLIYESVADPRGWESYAKRLTDVLEADFCHTLITDFMSPSHNYGIKTNSETGRLTVYQGDIYREEKLPEILEHLRDNKVFLAKDFFYHCETLYGDINSAFKIDFRCDNFIITHIKTRQKPPYYVMHMYGRNQGKPRFDNEHKKILDILADHVERAYALSLTMNHLSDLNKFIVRALDHIPAGVLILSNRGTAIAMNKIANRYIQEGHFILENQHISLNNKKANTLLQTALENILNKETPEGQYVPMQKPDGGKIYLCCLPHLLLQGASRHEWRLSDNAQTVIFITDDSRQITLPWENLKLIYNMTNSEARVVELLVNGRSTEDIAHLLEINTNSVRFHLKNCFNKTQVSNQAELVGLILRTLGNLPIKN